MTLADPKKNNIKKIANTNPVNIEKRRKLTEAFLNSEFYRNYFEPEIKKRIDLNDKISRIPDTTDATAIIKAVVEQKNKKSIYQGILNIFQEWIKKQNSMPGGK